MTARSATYGFVGLLALALAGPGALADDQVSEEAEQDATDEAEMIEEPAEEVVVYGDKFARWDGTRWYAEAQIGFPTPFFLHAEFNREFRATALQLRAVVACEKTFRRGKKRFEVDCQIEDVGLQATSFERGTYAEKNVDPVLQEMDDRLTDSKIRLYVSDDGRITNIDIDGMPENNRRLMVIKEEARQLLSRLMAGFHMRLPNNNMLREGQWLEYDSNVFMLPGMDGTQRGGSYLIHQLNPYKGHLVVQSVGKATVMEGDDTDINGGSGTYNAFKVEYDGVAIYDKVSGIMTERVYALHGNATASSQLADGWGGTRYFHTGRVRMLEDDETPPTVRATGRVSPPEKPIADIPLWEPME